MIGLRETATKYVGFARATHWRAWFAVRFVLCLIVACGFVPLPALADHVSSPHRVLYINSYHPQYTWTDQVTQGLVDALRETVPAEDIFIEYMDGRRHIDDPVHIDNFYKLLAHKYSETRPSIIVTADDTALKFMETRGQKLFPGIPVVFNGVNVPENVDFDKFSDITGIIEGMEIEGNFRLIRQVLPETNRIIMLSDTTSLGNEMAAQARKVTTRWGVQPETAHIAFEIWQDFSKAELQSALTKLPADTAVMILAIHKDRNGEYFSYSNDLEELSHVSAVPIWGMWGPLMLEYGVFGGMMIDGYGHGYETGEMVRQVLQNHNATSIPIRPQSTFTPQFDYAQLKRFHVNMRRLPKDSRIVGKPVSIFESHPQLIYGGISAFVGLLLVILVLSVNIRRRAVSEARLDNMNRNLEAIVDQRTRELNDRNTALQVLNNDMKNLAHTDYLTGLGNRRSASERLNALIQLTKVTQEPFVVAMVDLDHFKSINDSYGHEVGDQALEVVSAALTKGLRPHDMAFRWGGEEFLLVLTATGVEAAVKACERLRKSVAGIKTMQGYTLKVSMGLAQYQSGEDIRTFLHRADEALYTAKSQGRNQVVVAPD